MSNKVGVNNFTSIWSNDSVYILASDCRLYWHPYISNMNKDNDTKPSGYDQCGLPMSSVMSWITLSLSPCPWSGSLNVLQVPPSWHTSNKDINTKFPGYLPFGKMRFSMTLGLTMPSKSLIRNPQGPPSTPSMDSPFLTQFQLRYQHQIYRVSSLR